ncbi:MAG: cell division protein ZapA [Gammaproteobacteria bacterium]
MSKVPDTLIVKIFDKEYKVKCPAEQSEGLQAAARHLDQIMHNVRDAGNILALDRIAVLAALNITHEMLTLRKQKDDYIEQLHQRLQTLQTKIEQALAEEI